MHSTKVLALVAATAAFASSSLAAHIAPTGSPVVRRQLSNLPQCVQACLGQAMTAATVCQASEFNCLCHTQSFIDQSGNCYEATCSPADAQTGIDFGTNACKAIGVAVSFTPSASAGGAPAGSASASASSVASSAASSLSSSASSRSSASSSSASAASSSAAAASPAQAVTAHGLALPVVGLGLVTFYASSVLF